MCFQLEFSQNSNNFSTVDSYSHTTTPKFSTVTLRSQKNLRQTCVFKRNFISPLRPASQPQFYIEHLLTATPCEGTQCTQSRESTSSKHSAFSNPPSSNGLLARESTISKHPQKRSIRSWGIGKCTISNLFSTTWGTCGSKQNTRS